MACGIQVGVPLEDALRVVEVECPDPSLRPKFREAFVCFQSRWGEPLPEPQFSAHFSAAERELLFIGVMCGTLNRALEAAAQIERLRSLGQNYDTPSSKILSVDGKSKISGPDQSRAILYLLLEQGVPMLKALRFLNDEATALTPTQKSVLMNWSSNVSEGASFSSLCDPQLWGESFARQLQRFESEGDLLALRENLTLDVGFERALDHEAQFEDTGEEWKETANSATLKRRLDFYLRIAAELESGESLWNALWKSTEVWGGDRIGIAWRNWLREISMSPSQERVNSCEVEIEAEMPTCRFLSEREKVFFLAGLRSGQLPETIRSLASLGAS
jgi:type II secretory pathway component PulF